MITGDNPFDRMRVTCGTTSRLDLINIRIRTGGQMMPYRCQPDMGTAVVTWYYAPGVSVPTITPGTSIEIGYFRGEVQPDYLFTGEVADVTRSVIIDEATGEYGKQLTIYAVDSISKLQRTLVPGVITSRATKNQTWEQRLTTTLSPYFTTAGVYGFFPSTGTEAHIYRLVDNNVNGTLVDQVNLACNSVGATWYVLPGDNSVRFAAKGVYPTTGLLFTDEPGYWNAGNAPARASSVAEKYNMTYKALDVSIDSRDLYNELTVRNIMVANMITSQAGVLVYKDPPTTKVDALEMVEQTYTVSNNTSIGSYGRRPTELLTNLYPYRTTDSDSWYTRENAYPDPSFEYEQPIAITSSNARMQLSTVTPETGTNCVDVITTAVGASYVLTIGDPTGYPLRRLPTTNITPWFISWRTAQANARFTRGIQYLDSNGNVLLTQSSSTTAPTLNTWTQLSGVFMDYTAIPAGTRAWRPILTITHASGTFGTGTTIAKLDNVMIHPTMQESRPYFDGDTADTTADVYAWQSGAGASSSFRTRNIIDNIGNDALTYLKDPGLAPRYLEWNARQLWNYLSFIVPGARVDVRFNGTNYVSWIDSMQWDITAEDIILKLDLSRRPASWA